MLENKIAIIIKTYYREKCLFNCIKSIQENLNYPYRIYLVDDSPISQIKADLYRKLIGQGHFIKIYDKPIAVTKARNELIKNLDDERYILRIDDDFMITKETKVEKMIQILEKDNKIKVVSDLERQGIDTKNVRRGEIAYQQGFMLLIGPLLIKIYIPIRLLENLNLWKTQGGVRYFSCNFVRNFLLIKRDVFEKVCWEENLYFAGEHADFFLQISKLYHRGICFTPDSIHLHDPLISSDYSHQKKKHNSNKEEWYNKKWSIKYDITTGPLMRFLRFLGLD